MILWLAIGVVVDESRTPSNGGSCCSVELGVGLGLELHESETLIIADCPQRPISKSARTNQAEYTVYAESEDVGLAPT